MYQWTTEAIDLMMTWHREGLSMGAIAKRLGTSRNSVIGKVHRVQRLNGHVPVPRKRRILEAIAAANGERISPQAMRNTTPKRTCEPRRKMPAVSTQGIGRILPALTPPPPRTGPAAGILDVTGCRWPTGSEDAIPGRHTFCDAPKDGKGPYCPFHDALKVARPEPAAKRKRFIIPTSLLRAVG